MAATATARKASAPKAAPKAASKSWNLFHNGELIATSIWSSVLFFYVKKQPESAQKKYEVKPA